MADPREFPQDTMVKFFPCSAAAKLMRFPLFVSVEGVVCEDTIYIFLIHIITPSSSIVGLCFAT
jgi:hypothetical protein